MDDKGNLNNYIRPGERLDDLQRNGYVLIQDPSLFCFGMDAVLLADFARAGKKDHVLDMCTGNGVIPILMAARGKGGIFTGIELQEKSADLAVRNSLVNNLKDRFFVIQGDVRKTAELLKKQSEKCHEYPGRDTEHDISNSEIQPYKEADAEDTGSSFVRNRSRVVDVVTCNPPYMAAGDGLVNPGDEKAMARHEISCTLRDIAGQASTALKEGGHIYMVHRPRRLVEIFGEFKVAGLEPKRMRFVHSFASKEAAMVLIDAVKGGGAQMIVEPPLVIYSEDGKYTEEVRGMY